MEYASYTLKKSIKIILIVLLVLMIDQGLKVWIKTHFSYGQEISMLGLSWAKLHFVENNGMAFGLSLGGFYGKLALSLFRLIAVAILSYYIHLLIKANAKMGLLTSFALILAGAVGNIIDSAFYGMIFSDSYHGHTAILFPEGGGYAGFLHGKVVDMLYFPLFSGHFPEWLPFWAGEQFLFFRPVFNIADMSITIGVLSIILFYRNFFSSHDKKKGEEVENEFHKVTDSEDKQSGLAEEANKETDSSLEDSSVSTQDLNGG